MTSQTSNSLSETGLRRMTQERRSGRMRRMRQVRRGLAGATAVVLTVLAATPAWAAAERPGSEPPGMRGAAGSGTTPGQGTAPGHGTEGHGTAPGEDAEGWGAAPGEGTAGRGAAPGHGAAPGYAYGRGALLGITPLATLGRDDVVRFLAGPGLETGTVRYGVRAYRLTYRTITPQGRPTTATGLFVLPRGGERRLAVVSDTHGTMAHRDNAPSVTTGLGRLAPYLHASAGRAVAAPDYLGLGRGPGRHPYMDTASAVTASVDMLRAARTAGKLMGRPLTADVYATGFSQGGQVAMALGRALRNGAEPHFRLRALAPVSGPYDLEGAELPGLFDGSVNDESAVFYMSYFLTAQNRLHPVYRHPSEAFRAPYASRIERLFDGRHQEDDIVKALPRTLEQLLTPEFYERVRHPGGGLLAALRAQDGNCAWKPAAPVRLYTASGDTDVPIANARNCARDLARNGTRAPVLDQGNVDHFGTFKSATPRIARWFNTLGKSVGGNP
ncbi:alpha/beta hydrolase [Streptomyces sp. NBC_01142]|uniref:alpha/beta hydrolase n=1 Tax=Streptomyces sp. NBC_01142 TaxID=2975865 RepID=UPI002250AB1D|nr:alpha/beta hydrolase [Streptomyces sp. NBC_01142]MCX4822759.1 alpha/beta hydrolase [Streptomyces sp. NBC_01142]